MDYSDIISWLDLSYGIDYDPDLDRVLRGEYDLGLDYMLPYNSLDITYMTSGTVLLVMVVWVDIRVHENKCFGCGFLQPVELLLCVLYGWVSTAFVSYAFKLPFHTLHISSIVFLTTFLS